MTVHSVVFVGDVFLGGDLASFQPGASVTNDCYVNADVRIANLEQPISNRAETASKSTVFTGPEGIGHLRRLRISVVSLANNHIQDKTEQGIHDTVEVLTHHGIKFAGAGQNEEAAGSPCRIADDLYLLAYCDHGKPTLKEVSVATATTAGVNPLSLQKILADLSRLPKGARAALMFHWGVEQLSLPSFDDIELAKTLLKDPRVAIIVGSHAHRPQSFIEVLGKRAYFCLGNFLFPNFYIQPPTQMAPSPPERPVTATTYRYHAVTKLTYKKWLERNRISLVVAYNPQDATVRHDLVLQDEDSPVITTLVGFKSTLARLRMVFLSKVYQLPGPLYRHVYGGHKAFVRFNWRAHVVLFSVRERGIKWLIGKIASRFATAKH